MNISSVSTTNSYSPVSNKSEIAQLEKQKATLQTELSQVTQGTDDEKTKQAKSTQIQSQIQLIDAQIAQMRSEKSDQKQNTIEQKSISSDSTKISDKNESSSTSNSSNSASVTSTNIIDVFA